MSAIPSKGSSRSESRHEGSIPLHVLDLPQVHQRPAASSLVATLSQLAIKPSSWDATNSDNGNAPAVNEQGVPAYLTRIIMSPLDWLASDIEREEVWEAASKRLAERSGRTAMPSVSRTFTIPTLSAGKYDPKTIDVKIHEPSLTGDNLGHKTWVASYLLARRLPILISSHFPYIRKRDPSPTTSEANDAASQPSDPPITPSPPSTTLPQILELGAGTGLVGITASLLFSADIHLTDLPPILPNLRHNIHSNPAPISHNPSHITASILDWSLPHALLEEEEKYDIIVAADSLYAPEHASWLAITMSEYLKHSTTGRIFVELPFRCTKPPEHEQFRCEMSSHGFQLIEEGEETGFDDWEGSYPGERMEVKCWWTVWSWRESRA